MKHNSPTGGDGVTLEVDEAALIYGNNPSSTYESAVGSLAFVAGSERLTSFAFSNDLHYLNTNVDLSETPELVWKRIDDRHLVANFIGGGEAIALELVPPKGGIAADMSGAVTVVATLEDNLRHTLPILDLPFFDAGSVRIKASDGKGAHSTGTAHVLVRDDIPLAVAGSSSTISVHQSFGKIAIQSSAGASSQLDSATFELSGLQKLVRFGADGPGPVPFRLHVNAAGTSAVDANGNAVTSLGDRVLYQFVDEATSRDFGFSQPPGLGRVMFAFADGENNGGAFDPAHDRVVFTLTRNPDNSFTFDLKGPLDGSMATGSNSGLKLDLSKIFAPADLDDDLLNLPRNAIQVAVRDVPVASVHVAENSKAIATVISAPESAGAHYAIVGGDDASKFTIGVKSGALAFRSTPDFETPTDADSDNIYDVRIKVMYGAHTDTQEFAVKVTNVSYRVDGSEVQDVLVGTDEEDAIAGCGGADCLRGGLGNDLVIGGRGCDHLFGGSGADVFDFNSIADSVKGKQRDVVQDFDHWEKDLVDLSTIDANTKKPGDQAFKFIGSKDFHHKAGELHFTHGKLSGDLDGNGKADFEIALSGVAKMVPHDFFL